MSEFAVNKLIFSSSHCLQSKYFPITEDHDQTNE